MPFILNNRGIQPPHKVVADALPLIASGPGTAVDIGAGSGRNSIYLSQMGYLVDAIDRSPAAVSSLNAYARAHSLEIKARTADITKSVPDLSGYSLVLMIQVLHYLPLR